MLRERVLESRPVWGLVTVFRPCLSLVSSRVTHVDISVSMLSIVSWLSSPGFVTAGKKETNL